MAQHLPLQFLFAFIVAEYILSRRPSRVPWPSPLLGEMEIPKRIFLSISLGPTWMRSCRRDVTARCTLTMAKGCPTLHYTRSGHGQTLVSRAAFEPLRPTCFVGWCLERVDPTNTKLLGTAYKIHRAKAIFFCRGPWTSATKARVHRTSSIFFIL